MWERSSDRGAIRFVNANGVRLRTSVRGSGFPLLLITGLGASLDLAEPFERELVKRGHQVVSFDAPGVGESRPYLVPRRMRGVARTVARWPPHWVTTGWTCSGSPSAAWSPSSSPTSHRIWCAG